MASIAFSGLTCSELIMTSRQTKSIVRSLLGFSKWFVASFTSLIMWLSALPVPLFQRPNTSLPKIFRCIVGSLALFRYQLLKFWGHTITKGTSTGSIAVLMVKAHMTLAAKGDAIARLVSQFGELLTGFNVASIKSCLFPTMLTMPIRPRKDSKLPRPPQFFLSRIWLERNNILHTLSLPHITPISQMEAII